MSQQSQHATYGGSPPENYERYFVPAIGAPLAKDLIKVAALRPGERVLDAACGTGIVARLASKQVGDAGTVVGLDINPGMLAVARSVATPGTAIEWREGGVESMPFSDESFDAALCQMGLQFVPDKHAALSEMRRILAPGGRLILNVPGPTPEPFEIMGQALARHIGAEAAGFVYQVFSLYDPAELQHLMRGAGFQDVSVQVNDRMLQLPPPESFLWAYVYSTPLAGAVRKADEAARASLEREIVSKWQAFMEDGALMLQARMAVATAQK